MMMTMPSLGLKEIVGGYTAFVGFFHISEFAWAYLYHKDIVSFSSFCFSRDYLIAQAAGIIEFSLGYYLFPEYKTSALTFALGSLAMFTGEAIRKIAMFQAKRNFTHDIADEKKDHHQLVTSGIYSFVRHPGYCGWFIWAVGSQILLANPLCTVGFAYVSYRFFKSRVRYEERKLIQFFGDQYIEYKKKVPSGIPFVEGYPLPYANGTGTTLNVSTPGVDDDDDDDDDQ
jgi:protein-S-isoprenylcysteine O-methyltransferase